MVLFNLSDCPLMRGWSSVVKFLRMPRVLHTFCRNLILNGGPLPTASSSAGCKRKPNGFRMSWKRLKP